MRIEKRRIILLIFAGLFFMTACKAEKTVIEETPPIPEQAVEKFTITETEKGKLKMILESESAVINEEKKTAVLRLPRVKFYKEGRYVSTLIAESAEIKLDSYDVFGKGKCSVETADNEYLQTTDLSYNAQKELIYSANDVKITTKNEIITGKSFESDTKLKKIVIKKQKVILDNAKAGVKPV
ncbi:MAG: LPS export ABC transporter periplasmic protein LptC [Endomicrobium sp.]|jgi:LPS export ABC transporter protein LptC|nr:LPS export ABC transporter periplasmic protein LptC [Endomicrobium sp.]